MPWKKGKVKLDDGSEYQAEMLVREDGQVWNVRIHKEDGVIEEIDAQAFASKLGKSVDDVYPYSYELQE